MPARPTTPRRAPAPADVAAVVNGLRQVVSAVRLAARDAEARAGISGAQHFVLQCLAATPRLTLTQLAALTYTHKSSVSVVVSRLVRSGYVRRGNHPGDRRRTPLSLTPSGRRALAGLPDSAQSRMVLALEHLGAADTARFGRLFERFTRALGIGAGAPPMLLEEAAPRRPGGTLRRGA